MSVPKYWREMPQRYRLEAEKCVKCGKIHFPPRLVCSECGGREFEKVMLNNKGKISTYSVIHVGPSQFADQVPYAVAIVELNDGVNILCQIADCDINSLKTGMRVKVEFRRISENGKAGVINYGYKCVPE